MPAAIPICRATARSGRISNADRPQLAPTDLLDLCGRFSKRRCPAPPIWPKRWTPSSSVWSATMTWKSPCAVKSALQTIIDEGGRVDVAQTKHDLERVR